VGLRFGRRRQTVVDGGRVSGIRAIELVSVTHIYGSTAALRDVSLRLEPGVIHFVQGPNGAGKSTLLSVVGTVLRPTRGRVRFEPFGERRDLARGHIGWVAHESRCYPALTGWENVELAAALYGERGEAALRAVVERVQIGAFMNQPVGTLSRGQRQRVALARALVHRPSVLLLDEPLTGLDQETSERFRGILAEERDRGTLVVVVSHTAGFAESLDGQVIRVVRGRVVSEPAAQ